MPDGVALLERSIGYALGSMQGIQPAELGRGTPCGDWDLAMLLRHVADSTAALQEAVDGGAVAPSSIEPYGVPADPVSSFRNGLARLLGSWALLPDADRAVAVGGCALSTNVVAATGAVELAVHGWDIARARGKLRPIPFDLALELHAVAATLMTDRTGLFADPVPLPPLAGPSARLVAYLGRRP
jgi:uncharacterized protein (TIGR03086 family)